MKAMVQDSYGSPDVLEFRDVDRPVIKDGEVLIRMEAAAVHPGDLLLLWGRPYVLRLGFGLRRPRKRVPGFDVAGRVEAVGRNVTRFRPGDEVFGECGSGSLAEYVSAPERKLAPRPASLTPAQAAAVAVSATTALRALRDQAKVRPGQHVLINGAAGGIGTFAVQIAKSLGAEVTGVCGTAGADLVRSIGADHVIDYTLEDFTRSGRHYDVILDNVGNHSLSACRRALTRTGMLLPNNGTSGGPWFGTTGRIPAALVMSLFVRQKLRPFVAMVRRSDLDALTELIEAGKVTPVIDRTYPLEGAADALRYLEQGHAHGKIVVTT